MVAGLTVTLAPHLWAMGTPVVAAVTTVLCLIGIGWFTLLSRHKMH